MREQGVEMENKESLYREYLNLMGAAVDINAKLLENCSRLSEKAMRRLVEFKERLENIELDWKSIYNTKDNKPRPDADIIKEYHDIIPMLKELIVDMKRFEEKKDSI